jgi:hypothetical protein
MKTFIILSVFLSAFNISATGGENIFSSLADSAKNETEFDLLRVAAVRYCSTDVGWLKWVDIWDKHLANQDISKNLIHPIIKKWIIDNQDLLKSAPEVLKEDQRLELIRMLRYVTIRELAFFTDTDLRPYEKIIITWRQFLNKRIKE